MDTDRKYKINSNREYLLLYHTSLRNVGLYTSLAFAALAYSRYYRSKDQLLNILLLIGNLLLLGIAMFFSYILIDDSIQYYSNNKKLQINKYIIVPKILFGFDFILLLLGLYILYKVLKK